MVPASRRYGPKERRLADQDLPLGAKITRLLRALDFARRAAWLYPDDHPRLAGSLEELSELIGALCEESPFVKITIYQEECFLNGESPDEELVIPAGFSDRFLRLGLASVVFPRNANAQELLGFLRFLGSDPRGAADAEDINARARPYLLGSIELEGLDYGKLFAEDIGLPAEVSGRDEEQFARLLTLWDPREDQRPMSDGEIKALTRLAEDQTDRKSVV